jgi:hypothetical protein
MTDEELLVGLKRIGKRVSMPCPDGLEGCLVHHFGIETDPVAARAIDRIEALTAEIDRLRAALFESVALNENYYAVEEDDGYQFTEAPAVIAQARTALEKQP